LYGLLEEVAIEKREEGRFSGSGMAFYIQYIVGRGRGGPRQEGRVSADPGTSFW
jgi:hypothetical protein